ncbi:MAG: chemotaxis-specific protein-glutamate methyltransferase CheB [Methylococcales bacterium]|jgi:two-component system, chemotaxis family, response regulator WspF|nr:chemotaxis-specific protein-glutamate methyltransferase CheB [Methylococcales bacterium]MBT7410136.1 chemotaxis-specific protein-glutamate methyltransferase CheB [Methylococcales bacterium]
MQSHVNNQRKIRIAIASASNTMADLIKTQVKSNPLLQISWVAKTGANAIEKCHQYSPKLLLLDINITDQDSLVVTQKISIETQCPILLITDQYQKSTSKIFDVMGAGALDVVDLKSAIRPKSNQTSSLLQKILGILKSTGCDINTQSPEQNNKTTHNYQSKPTNKLIAIGASTGGPIALADVISKIPTNISAAIVVIQHLDAQFSGGFIDWLNEHVEYPVRAAKTGDFPETNTVLVPNGSDHLILKPDEKLYYTPDPINYVYRPSVNEFFESVAQHWKGTAVGILLTGMGKDGATGLLSIKKKGFYTIAQDEKSCAVYGMPKAAVKIEAADAVLDVKSIGSKITQLLSK